jgi:hypothetical protein
MLGMTMVPVLFLGYRSQASVIRFSAQTVAKMTRASSDWFG